MADLATPLPITSSDPCSLLASSWRDRSFGQRLTGHLLPRFSGHTHVQFARVFSVICHDNAAECLDSVTLIEIALR